MMIKAALIAQILTISIGAKAQIIELGFSDLQKMKIERTERGLKFSQGYFSEHIKKTKCTEKTIDQYWSFLKSQVKDKGIVRCRSPLSGEAKMDGQKFSIEFGTEQFSLLRQAGNGFDAVMLWESSNCSKRKPASEVVRSKQLELVPPSIRLSEWKDKLDNPSFKRKLNACLDKICLNSSRLPSLSVEKDRLIEEAKPFSVEFQEKVAPKVNGALSIHNAKELKKLESLRRSIENSGNLSSEARTEIGTFTMKEIRDDYTCKGDVKIGEQSYCPPMVNMFKAAPEERRAGMRPSPISVALSEQDESRAIEIMKAIELSEFTTKENVRRLQLKGTEEELSNPSVVIRSIQNTAGRYLELISSLEKSGNSPEMNGEYFDRSFIERMKLGENISIDDLNNLILLGGRLNQYAHMKTNPIAINGMLNLADIVMTEPKTREALLSTIRTRIENLKKEVDAGKMMTVSFATCQEAYALQMIGAPTASELIVGKSTVEYAKNAVVSALSRKLSATSVAKIDKMLSERRTVFPPSRDVVRAKYVAALKDIEARGSRALSQLCLGESGKGGLIEDRTSLITGEVYVSGQSLRHPELGRKVLSHEYAHQVSGSFQRGELSERSTAAFKNARICLSNKHKFESNLPMTSLKVGGSEISETSTCEEDWADLVSGLASEGEMSNKWCIAYNGRPSESVYNIETDRDDSHSGVLFRLLHLQKLQTGIFPTECSEIIDNSGHPFDFSSCL